MINRNNVLALGGFILLCFCAAAIGGLATATAIDTWYITLVKPSWTPPGWVFGSIWTVLYLMMAMAAWLVWLKRKEMAVRSSLQFFLVQLTMNAMWSVIFFGLRRVDLAFFWIGLLWIAIVVTMMLFKRVSLVAALLLVPYLIWVTIAQALNFEIWRLNF